MNYSKLSELIQSSENRGVPRGEPVTGGSLGGSQSAGGLSLPHKWRKKIDGKFECALDGTYIKVIKPRLSGEQVGGGKRGKISGFSSASKRRLLQTLAKTIKENKPVFITLTYPAEWPENPKQWKRHLQNFIKRLSYKYPKASGFWKLEPQYRGAPHYHLLIWGVSYYDLLCFTSLAWYKVVKSGDIKHLHAGTRVEQIRSWKGVRSYASKYLGKKIEGLPGWESVGRFWGIFGREKLPWAKMISVELDYKGACKIIRLIRRYAHIKSRDYKSLTGLVNNPSYWFDRLHLLI